MATTIEERMAQIRAKNLWDANEILPRLYLGNGRDASNKEKLTEGGFTHIINVANDVENYFPDDFLYLNLHVGDFGSDTGITRVFPSAFAYLEEHWKNNPNSKILIHCAAGMNRSATLYIAFVMYIEKKTLVEAWELVRNKRRVSPLQDNRKELLKYEKELFGNNTMDKWYC